MIPVLCTFCAAENEHITNISQRCCLKCENWKLKSLYLFR